VPEAEAGGAEGLLAAGPLVELARMEAAPERLDQAVEGGRASLERVLPMIKRMLEPVSWGGAGGRLRAFP
jgi:hypothetical protein